MASHIKKVICSNEFYYKGDEQWTDKFAERKQYNSEADAQEEHHRYSGVVVNE